MLVQHNRRLYKYIRADADSPSDRWAYSEEATDVWSTYDADGGWLRVMEYSARNELTKYSQPHEDELLFSRV